MPSLRPKIVYQMFKRKGGGVKGVLNNVKNAKKAVLFKSRLTCYMHSEAL